MPLIKIKLFESDKLSTLATAIAAYLTANAATKDAIRGQSASSFLANDGDTVVVKAMAWAGQLLPVTKTADVQHVTISTEKLADAQAALDAALASVVHETHTDGDTTTPGTLTSAGSTFAAEDVGRKIRITESGVVKEKAILTRVSDTEITYDNTGGNFVSGTGVTFSMLGAESIQEGSLSVDAYRANDGDTCITVDVACEGQAPA